jgi:hypothetical protein
MVKANFISRSVGWLVKRGKILRADWKPLRLKDLDNSFWKFCWRHLLTDSTIETLETSKISFYKLHMQLLLLNIYCFWDLDSPHIQLNYTHNSLPSNITRCSCLFNFKYSLSPAHVSRDYIFNQHRWKINKLLLALNLHSIADRNQGAKKPCRSPNYSDFK